MFIREILRSNSYTHECPGKCRLGVLLIVAGTVACHSSRAPRVESAGDVGTGDAGPTDSGPPTISVGGSCTNDSMCIPLDDGAIGKCLQGGPYPGGYCSETCSGRLGANCGTTSIDPGGGICMGFLLGEDGLPASSCYQYCDQGWTCSRPGYVCADYVAPGGVGVGPSIGSACLASCSSDADCNQGGGQAGVCAAAYLGGSDTLSTAGVVCVPACTSNDQCPPQNFCHKQAGDALQGQCGLAPIAPPTAEAGTAQAVMSGLEAPWGLVSSGDHLIWGQSLPVSCIATVPTTGASSIDFLTPGPPTPLVWSFAADGANLYWANSAGVLQKMTLASHTATILTSALTSLAAGMAVDATNVYGITTGDFSIDSPGNGGVFYVPIGGGDVTPISMTENQPVAIATDGVNIYWTDFGNFTASASAPGYVYAGNGAILKASIGDWTITTLASGQAWPTAIATDGTNVYWINLGTPVFNPDASEFELPPGSGAVMQVAVDGGAAIPLASAQDNPVRLIAAASRVIWLSQGTGSGSVQNDEFVGTGTLYMTSPGSSSPTLLAAGVVDPSGITYSQGSLYFITGPTALNNGMIWEYPLPASPGP